MSKDACRAHQSVAGEAFGNGARVGGLAVVARNGLEQIFFLHSRENALSQLISVGGF